MNTSEAIRARRSIRKFKEGVKIPLEHINLMLEAAMMAPSACNTRPWEFVVIADRHALDQVMEIHTRAGALKTASAAVLVCGRPDLQENICNGFWPQDCGAAIENFLLQAQELGYGTCWCGCYPVMERAEKLQSTFHLSSIPLAVIAVGESAESPDARGFFDPKRVTYIL